MALKEDTARTGTATSVRGVQRAWSRMARFLAGRPETGVFAAALAVFVFFTLWAGNFLTAESFASTLTIASELGIVSMAVTLLMIAGEFDLSVGSVLGITSMVVPWLMVNYNSSALLSALAAIGLAAAIGSLNGAIVTKARIPSFIVTLGALLFWRGTLFVFTKGFPVTVPREALIFRIFSYQFASGFYISTLWFVVLAVSLSFMLTTTKFGNWIFASGGNERAARNMGVPVDQVRVILFVLTGLAAWLAGLVQVGRFGSVDANRGTGLELEAIAAAVIGGARLSGGAGSVIGTALGCLMVGMIRNGLALAGVASYWYSAIIGLLIVTAVIINQLVGKARVEKL